MQEREPSRRSLFLLAALVPLAWLVVGSSAPVLGQSAPAQPGNTQVRKNGLLVSQPLAQEPRIPNFPRYTGKYLKYLGGSYSSGLTKGYCCKLNYETTDLPEQVINWYQSALKSAGYQVSEPKHGSFNAQIPEAAIVVVISAHPMANIPYYRCHFGIRYIDQSSRQK